MPGNMNQKQNLPSRRRPANEKPHASSPVHVRKASHKGISTAIIKSEGENARATTSEDEGLTPGTTDDDGVVIICLTGIVILQCKADDESEAISFKVDSARLKQESRYFNRLLTNANFAEGAAAMTTASNVDSASPQESSRVFNLEVVDVGRISPVKSIQPLMTDFLLILHRDHAPTRKIPLVNLANLAIVADRFDATTALAAFVRNTNAIVKCKLLKYPVDEERMRQRLLLGLFLKDEELFRVHSRDLILAGSTIWPTIEVEPPNDALWWDLPRNIEGS